MLAALLIAAEAAAPSHTPFYLCAGALIVFALILSAVGAARHETFPASRGLAVALIGVCFLLVAGTMFTAVITA